MNNPVVTSLTLPRGYKAVHMPLISEKYFAVYHNEIGYNKQYANTWVAGFNENTKEARPCHGYYPDHKTGVKMKKFFTASGYNFPY